MVAPARILVVRLGAVGDVIRTLPLLHAVRREHPDAFLGWAVESPSAPLLRELPALDVVHELPRRRIQAGLARPGRWPETWGLLRRFVRELRDHRYELVLDVHGTLKAAVIARLAGGDRLAGLAPPGSKEGARFLHHVSHAFPAEPMSRVARALFLGRAERLLDEAAVEGGGTDFGLRFPADRTRAVDAFVESGPRPLVVLFPFASRAGQAKRWPLPFHCELGAALHEGGCRVVLAWGGPSERDEAESALRAAGVTGSVELAPPTDLVELAALLRGADVLVTGDTGPMHLAAGVGTPTVALFGPSDPIVNRPWGEGHRVLVHQPLTSLGVGTVHEAVKHVLQGAGPGRRAAP